MNQFFKFLFASCFGVILAIIALALIGIGVGSIIVGSQEELINIDPNSVLVLSFDEPVPELTNNLERDPFNLKNDDILGLQDILDNIEHAKADKDIKGIYIKSDESSLNGLVTSAVIRQAITDFSESGKFVYAYSEWYGQGSYYLASAADKVFIHPMGSIDFRGFAAVIPFFKEMLDKIGVKFQAFYAGDFKSATEPYRRVDMSEENRLQLRSFLEEIHQIYMQQIAAARDLQYEVVDSIAEHLLIDNAKTALDFQFVDEIAYKDEVATSLRTALGLEQDEDINLVSLKNYHKSWKKEKDYSIKDKIAVVYAEGTIVDGDGGVGQVGAEAYGKILKKLRKNDKIKAIVLRINSPGGSGLASENIWRELQLAKEAGKKIVVSMGNYAASGGYYISCPADTIFAEAESLTGSIGVFNLFPNIKSLMNDKLHIHFDTVKTGQYAAGFNPVLGLAPKEEQYLQNFVDELYERFLMRVADGRDMTRDEVHAIAQGRIWSGRKAIELGLVDKIGGLDEALSSAATLAGLEKYRVDTYPKPKTPLQQLLEELTGKKDADLTARAVEKELGEWGVYYKYIKEMKEANGVQFRMPYIITLQ